VKVLLLGNGGREDALAWALGRSPLLSRLCCAPGNAGIARRCETLGRLAAGDVEAVARVAREGGFDLVVVGPEAPLVAGIADRLSSMGIPVFGPSAGGARIEGSKVFAKEFMSRHAVPTARFRVFDALPAARRHLESGATAYPLVVKADGLAGGKGVVLADDAPSAIAAAESMLVEGRFGDAGARIVVEERLVGREASFFVLSDGERFVELETCQDYKRAFDGDRGPNTGGMGACSPSVWLDAPSRAAIVETIVKPTLDGLAAEGSPYRGVLYAGIMLTAAGPRVLEFNARFGDPETQALVPRLGGDWLELLHACATGRLDRVAAPRWREECAVCVVMASGGYPGEHARGRPIRGVEDAQASDGVEVFHAGTATSPGGELVTAGGRVLGVTALGADVSAARDRAYAAVGRIHWEGEHHRADIALDAVASRTGRRR
jgi:phosphoribosylamine--glycine ligase